MRFEKPDEEYAAVEGWSAMCMVNVTTDGFDQQEVVAQLMAFCWLELVVIFITIWASRQQMTRLRPKRTGLDTRSDRNSVCAPSTESQVTMVNSSKTRRRDCEIIRMNVGTLHFEELKVS